MSEKAKVADTYEAPRQHVQQKAPQEFGHRQAHTPLLVVMCRIAPAKGDAAVLKQDESMVGYGHPVRVATQITQRMFSTAERAFAINHPIRTVESAQHSCEDMRLLQRGKFAMKTEFTGGVEGAQTGDKLTPEDSAENLDGQKEVAGRSHPACMVGRQTAGRHDTVNMRVVQQLLIPGMEHAEEANLGAEVARVTGDLQQRVRSGTK